MDLVQQTAEKLAHKKMLALELILKDAISNAIGDNWSMSDLVGRVDRVRIRDETMETFRLDEKPILEIWPIEVATKDNGKDGVTLNASWKYRVLS